MHLQSAMDMIGEAAERERVAFIRQKIGTPERTYVSATSLSRIICKTEIKPNVRVSFEER